MRPPARSAAGGTLSSGQNRWRGAKSESVRNKEVNGFCQLYIVPTCTEARLSHWGLRLVNKKFVCVSLLRCT